MCQYRMHHLQSTVYLVWRPFSTQNQLISIAIKCYQMLSNAIKCYQILSNVIKCDQNSIKMNFKSVPLPLIPPPSSPMTVMSLLTSQVGMWKFVRQFGSAKEAHRNGMYACMRVCARARVHSLTGTYRNGMYACVRVCARARA